MVVQPHTRPVTVEEYCRIAEAGVIGRDGRVEVLRDPSPDRYRLALVCGRGQWIAPTCAPDLAIKVDVILGEVGRESR